MDESGEPRPHDQADQAPETRRVYPPAEVQARLEVSASGLRRLAGIYERTMGPLPRDDRGRVWPEDAIGELEEARALVRDQRAVSIEAALRGQDGPQGAERAQANNLPTAPAEAARGDTEPVAAILEELRALRGLVEEQNRRIAELEEAVRTGRELPAGEPTMAQDAPEGPAEGYGTGDRDHPGGGQAPTEREPGGVGAEDRGPWRRVARWFGFGAR